MTMSSTTATRNRNVIAGVVVLVAVLAITLVVRLRHDHPVRAPYTDPAARGSIGLCDRSGAPLTSGSTKGVPFAWRALGSTPAPSGYAGAGRTATLYVFQPRAGAEPATWSGHPLTAAAEYSHPAHPMAAATDRDVDLADFLAGYPARDSGFLQLRLYLGAPGRAPLTNSYDALDLHVTGSTWRAMGGHRLDCHAGTAVSFETLVGSGHS